MALIGRIRKRVGLLIGFVGISMILFILGDLVTSNTGLLHRNSDVLGVIGGEKIRYSVFEKRVELLTENYKLNTKSDNLDQSTQDMLREQAWNMFLNENTVGEEYKKLGISCSSEELYYLCTGPNPHPQIRQAFTDPKTGQFDPNNVVKFLKDLPNRDEATQKQWKQFEDALRDERVANKYKEFIKSGIFVTSVEAKDAYLEGTRAVNIRYIRLDYNTIPDSSAKLEDDDLLSYYNANKDKYKQTETTRKIEYVTFDVNPSPEDRQKVMDWINKKKEEFAQSTNDTLFVLQNSDNSFDSSFHAKGTLSPLIDSVFFSSAPGAMIGPYEEGNSVKLSKFVAEKQVSDSVKARHILFKVEGQDTGRVVMFADSIKELIKKGASFAEYAGKFSADPGSASKGGDLGWFKAGMMVKPFNDACFDGKKGDLTVVISQFGVHLIEVLDKGPTTRQIQVGTVERKFEPSQKTFDDVFNKANQFAGTNNTAASFDSACIKMGLNKRIADNLRETDKNIPGLEQPREIIRWAYQANKDDVSKAFTLSDKYVIAHLVDIREKGILPMEMVKDQVTQEARKLKKGDLLIEKFNKAGATTIDALAQKLNVSVADGDNITFMNPFLPAGGSEPAVIGTAFGLKAGQLSKPIRGENGVSVCVVKSFTEAPAITDYSANIKQVLDQRKSRSEYEVFNVLKEKAKVEDNRGRFY